MLCIPEVPAAYCRMIPNVETVMATPSLELLLRTKQAADYHTCTTYMCNGTTITQLKHMDATKFKQISTVVYWVETRQSSCIEL